MAILDRATIFSGTISAAGVIAGQTVTGTNTTVNGTDVYDTTGGLPTAVSNIVDLGDGSDLEIDFSVLTAFAGGTSLELRIVTSDDTAQATNKTVLASSGAIPIASLGAGQKVTLKIPRGEPRAIRRYLGVDYVIVGTMSAGAVFAAIPANSGDQMPALYKSGFTVA